MLNDCSKLVVRRNYKKRTRLRYFEWILRDRLNLYFTLWVNDFYSLLADSPNDYYGCSVESFWNCYETDCPSAFPYLIFCSNLKLSFSCQLDSRRECRQFRISVVFPLNESLHYSVDKEFPSITVEVSRRQCWSCTLQFTLSKKNSSSLKVPSYSESEI